MNVHCCVNACLVRGTIHGSNTHHKLQLLLDSRLLLLVREMSTRHFTEQLLLLLLLLLVLATYYKLVREMYTQATNYKIQATVTCSY